MTVEDRFQTEPTRYGSLDYSGPVDEELSRVVREHGLRTIHVAWHTDLVSATQIGWRIADLDRAVRRLAIDPSDPQSVRKVPAPDQGGLAFVDAAPGSADILFEVFGLVREVLASEGLDALLKAIGLTGAIHKVWGFVFRQRDPLSGVSGRQVLEILREYQAMQRPPDGVDAIGDPPGISNEGATRVSILVEHDDGTRTIVTVEMRR